MTFFAQFDPTAPAPAPIVGYYDTGDTNYPNLPPENALLTLTPDQWDARMNGYWAVSDGKLVPYAPEVTTSLGQQAYQAINGGLTITLNGTITQAATLYPTDADTQQKIAAVITTVNATGAFPGGATSYPMKDSVGAWHTFTVDQYKVVAGAIAAYVAGLSLIMDGNPLEATALPPNAITLTV